MKRFVVFRPWSVLSFVALLSACGGSDSGNDGGGELDQVRFTEASVTSLDPVYLEGIPEAAADPDVEYGVAVVGGNTDLAIPVLQDEDDGRFFFYAPFHPDTPTEGGSVTLRLVGPEGTSGERTLEVAGLPDAPSALADFAASLREEIDQYARRVGSSYEELEATSFEDVSIELFPLRYAQSFIDDDASPDSFVRIIDGTSTFLDAEGLRLLNQILGQAKFDALVQAEIEAFGELEPPFEFTTQGLKSTGPKQDCIDFKPEINTAAELSVAMWEAKFAEITVTGARANTLSAMGKGLAVLSVLGGPVGAAAGTVGAGALAAWQAAQKMLAGTRPSRFDSITADVDITEFNEDSTDRGGWSNVRVTASSTGWIIDQALFDAAVTALGAGAVAAELRGLSLTLGQSSAFAQFSVSGSDYVGDRSGGLVNTCPQTWPNIDISSPAFCEARSVSGYLTVASGAQWYEPKEAGVDFLSISNIPSKFAQQLIDVDKEIEVKAIEVTTTPSRIIVSDPGTEVVNITAMIENADLETLRWNPGNGEWGDNSNPDTNGPTTRPLQTPANRMLYPFEVKVSSLSRRGARASGMPERSGSTRIVLGGDVTVLPANTCISNDDEEQFEAFIDGEPTTAVTWTLETSEGAPSSFGFVNPTTGLYEPPPTGSGSAVVIATSNEVPENRGGATIEVGPCSCRFSIAVESFSVVSGDFASHAFPSQFGFFQMTFQNDNPNQLGMLNGGGVTELATGTFQPDSFSLLSGSRFCGTNRDDGDTINLFITKNNESNLEGFIEGTCREPTLPEETIRTFTVNFRSGDLGSGADICGEN